MGEIYLDIIKAALVSAGLADKFRVNCFDSKNFNIVDINSPQTEPSIGFGVVKIAVDQTLGLHTTEWAMSSVFVDVNDDNCVTITGPTTIKISLADPDSVSKIGNAIAENMALNKQRWDKIIADGSIDIRTVGWSDDKVSANDCDKDDEVI